ncbi:hypothetical protein JCGZ_11194 [Jatropha curcas]|uniref:ZF-HD dimerization-type domain-containing protein n=2 Tax=Jatropha curcas TaxID=180498 RepID=A0A067KFE0_JATCU|nr:hypothetical protein JCGZ_11194 [Jatropha curcas]
MRNHAASIGGHANDGCGEFMPRGAADDGSLTCAACGCHRNFHRRETEGTQLHSHHYEHFFLSPPPPPVPQQILLYNAGGGGSPSTVNKKHLASHHEFFDDEDDHDRRSQTPERGEVNVGGLGGRATAVRNKRFRTKFTQEQKDRMLEFAEKIGWRINKQDDVALKQFCSEIGVKRNVLKVWMHNNKNAHRRTREEGPLPSTADPPPTVPSQPVGV